MCKALYTVILNRAALSLRVTVLHCTWLPCALQSNRHGYTRVLEGSCWQPKKPLPTFLTHERGGVTLTSCPTELGGYDLCHPGAGLGTSCCCCCQVTSVVSDSVRPHRRQPTRLSSPWDSPGKNKSFSRVRLFETPWTAAYQTPPPIGFSRQEYWSGVPLWYLLPRYLKTCQEVRYWEQAVKPSSSS